MREPLTHDELDGLLLTVDGASATEHQELARKLRAWAEEPHPLDGPSPRELLTNAGRELQLAGDDEAALREYRRAASSRGLVAVDPRCMIVELLHRRGEHSEADAVEQELRRSRPASAATYARMGELSEERGEDVRALGWYNRGISLAEDQGLVEAEMGRLCVLRWRLRRRTGQDPDHFDEFAIDFEERVARAVEHA